MFKPRSTLYSLVVTAKHNGLDVHAYLRFVFEGLAAARTCDEIEQLLPENAPASLRLPRHVN